MTDELERRWDDAVEQAWAEHRRDLADRLADLEPGDAVVVGVPDGEQPAGAVRCRVAAHEADRLVVELPGTAPTERLRDLGFADDLRCELPRREADRAAWVVVEVLRGVHGVVHPSWLHPGAATDLVGPVDPAPAPDADFPPQHAGPWAPRGDAQVRGAVTRVVRELLDAEPEWDADGDLPLATDRSLLLVVVARGVPRILLSATLLTEVVDEQRALVETNLLNRRHVGLSFALLEGRVVVRRELPVASFVPAEVTAELSRLLDHLDGWVTELQARLGGRALDEDAPAAPQHRAGVADADDTGAERYRAAFAVMKELEREDRASLDPPTLVRVFHADRALLMTAIAHTRAREAHWRERARQLAAEGRGRSAKVSSARAAHHRDLRSRLRRALRITVRARPSDVPEQLALFPQEDATS